MTAVAPSRPGLAMEATGLFGVYAHVPFCLSRCHYCDFVTYTGMEGLRRPYAAALLAEAELAVAATGPEPSTVTSVFIGGGTPTLLPAGDLGRLLERLRELLPFAPDVEVTVEANPETVDQAVADGLVEAGVTRVSLGAQSFDEGVLAALGRTHGPARVGQAVAALRRAGVEALNLDLIFGCPSEDDASWADSLAAAVALGPDHLSAYALTIEAATRFGRMVADGRMAEPDEDLLADRYETACAVLAASGWRHYEVSNWARDPVLAGAPHRRGALPSRASRHNLTYWRRGPYLGLGAGAHEFTGGVRRWNGPGVPAYLAALAAGRRPTAGEERLDGEQAAFELLALRLRTADGLDQAEAERLGIDPTGAPVAELRRAGLLAPGPGVALTERGMFLHGEVVARLAA
ncbi:MAG TPA: radical SAM family heme chaperone HemW [Actinomycetota bacterium]|jgi:putative oxygen-independent coproporphyrinogen III oxidase|nr:radical SAM family heme chaperone HemW [Actinomycetota bacterium]